MVLQSLDGAEYISIRELPFPRVTLRSSTQILLDAPQTLTGDLLVVGALGVLGGPVTVVGAVSASGDVVAGGKSLITHTHTGSPTAPTGAVSNTGAPV